MKISNKKIDFRPISKDAEVLVTKPRPARFYIPDWYKKIPKFENNEMAVDLTGGINATMKMCIPFLDTFMTGYIQETWCDTYFEIKEDGDYRWSYASSPTIMQQRKMKSHYPKIDGFFEEEFAWQQVWIPKLPKGYSMLYTHPLNRYDLPFISLTGIIDNDELFMENVANHPFYIKDKFSGFIPKGTPMYQMIPIKRDSWKSNFLNYNEELSIGARKLRQYFIGGYKKLYWQKKDYS